jgi:hypothetical protein|tara:strand:- start:703 stop:1929 length:1227 start_codon:yes stop_codon:yes gene_type:complete
MSGVIYKDSNISEKSKLGIPGNSPESIYLPMVPGVVESVVVGQDDTLYFSKSDVNSILARKHVGDPSIKKKYYPLLRGIVDTPVAGDSVFLIDGLAGQDYYLGPLNSLNHPNFTPDPLNSPSSVNINDNSSVSKKSKSNIPANYKITNVKRLSTLRNKKLDDPNGDRKGEDGSIAKEETFGDMIFEGRYGNSIRLGFRDTNPLIIISNGRNSDAVSERVVDGTFISMTTLGSLYENFGQFTLGSDSVDNNPRLVAGGNESEETQKFNYEYGNQDGTPILASQLFINSDKITFNSRKDNITLSSFKNIDVGAGNNLTINTKNYTSIESSNIYLGKQAQQQNEPMVLGNQLKIIFDKLLSIIEGSKMTGCIAGLSGPLDPNTLGKIQSLKNELNNFKSQYHYIEDNGQKA